MSEEVKGERQGVKAESVVYTKANGEVETLDYILGEILSRLDDVETEANEAKYTAEDAQSDLENLLDALRNV